MNLIKFITYGVRERWIVIAVCLYFSDAFLGHFISCLSLPENQIAFKLDNLQLPFVISILSISYLCRACVCASVSHISF